MKYIKILAPLLVALFCTSACSVKNDTLNVMGYNYLFGVGTEKDYAKAVECFRIAAEDGHAGAQNHLAYCYDNGFGVEQDYVEAVRLYKLSADQGFVQAQNNLGYIYS